MVAIRFHGPSTRNYSNGRKTKANPCRACVRNFDTGNPGVIRLKPHVGIIKAHSYEILRNHPNLHLSQAPPLLGILPSLDCLKHSECRGSRGTSQASKSIYDQH